jgi:hypothetical protein
VMMFMEDWKKELEAIRTEGEKLRTKKMKIAEEKEEQTENADEFIRIAKPYLEDVVSVYKQEGSKHPMMREKTTEWVGGAVQCDLVLYMGGGQNLCLRSFQKEGVIYFSATGYFRFTKAGKTCISHHIITVDKPVYDGNTVFNLKDEHIREAIQKFLKAYHERIARAIDGS